MSEDPQEPLQEEKPSVAPIWAVSAKIIEERPYGPGGRETRRGTGKFNANQKVYICGSFGGMGHITVTVVGRYRGKYKYITLSMSTRFLTRFRVEMVYSPTVIQHMSECRTPDDGSDESRQRAERVAKLLTEVADELRAKKLKHIEEQQSKE